jgi:hypothetical protein
MDAVASILREGFPACDRHREKESVLEAFVEVLPCRQAPRAIGNRRCGSCLLMLACVNAASHQDDIPGENATVLRHRRKMFLAFSDHGDSFASSASGMSWKIESLHAPFASER